MQIVTSRTPCPVCECLLSTDDLSECRACHELYCVNCSCDCNPETTSEQAVAGALAFLRSLGHDILPGQTLIVEDEWGAFYGSHGSSSFLSSLPPYQGEFLEFYLPDEFMDEHDQRQKEVRETTENGHAEYLTQNFAVAIHQFEIDCRAFTASVFHRYTAA
jgi:hypothetical protein